MTEVDGLPVEAVLNRFPDAPISPDNVEVYRARLAHRLVVRRCRDCSTMHEPPRMFCPACHSADLKFVEVSGRGRVALFSRVRTGPDGFGIDYAAGHPIAVVELDEQPGLRYAGEFVTADGRNALLDERVELCWIERSGSPVPAFRPTEEN